jgi:hypothetical protein
MLADVAVLAEAEAFRPPASVTVAVLKTTGTVTGVLTKIRNESGGVTRTLWEDVVPKERSAGPSG